MLDNATEIQPLSKFLQLASPQNKRAKPLVSAYDDSDKVGIEEDLDFYEDPKQKKKLGELAAGARNSNSAGG